MDSKETIDHILRLVPFQPPFRFIDEISYLDPDRIAGNFQLKEEFDFYKGHFPGFPVTPGVILTEIMAQTGMVAFGIYLMMLEGEREFRNMVTLLTETRIRFKKSVQPPQKVFIDSRKILFRHGKLSCDISLRNEENQLLCFGDISGMLYIKS